MTASGSNDKGLGVFIAANKERRGNFDYKNQYGDVVEMKNSGYNTEGVNLKLDQTIGDDDRITFAFEHNNSEGGVPYDTWNGFVETDELLPLYSATKYIEFGSFLQKLDSTFILIWIIAFVSYLSIALKFSSHIFKKLTNTENENIFTYCYSIYFANSYRKILK